MMYHQPQRNQMPHAPFYHTMPPHISYGDDPSRYPSYDATHGFTYPPMQPHGHGHGCCNHNYFPDHFAMRPPCPYHSHVSPAPVPAPPLYPFCYPGAQGMYPPVAYYPPPGYGYDNDMLKGGGHHCCGWCQNHPSEGKQGGNIKIVEEEPEVEKKTSSSLVPFEAKNYPYPYLVPWLQPSKMMNAEENKISDKNFGTHTSEKQQQQPIIWNGWFPYDMRRVQPSNQEEKKTTNQEHEEGAKSHQPLMSREWFPLELSKLGSRKQDDEQEGNQHRKDDDKERNLPFPIFWMPYNPRVAEGEEEKSEVMKHDKEQEGNQHQKDYVKYRNLPFPMFWMPYKPRITEGEEKQEKMADKDTSKKISGESEVPLHIINVPPEKHTDNNEKKPEKNVSGEERANVPNTNRVVKTIPVKQLEEQDEGDRKASSKIEEVDKKPLGESANKQSSSPRKASKLPPVCLRVEPLPKRKGANGNSRSPSPPGDKRKTSNVSGTGSANSKTKEGRENHSEIADGSILAEKRSKSLEKANEAANRLFEQGEVKLGFKTGDDVSHDNTVKKENVEGLKDSRADQSVDSNAGQKGKEDLEAKITAAEDHSVGQKVNGDLEAKITAAEDHSSAAKDSSEEETKESKKVRFSDAEAATMIQAAYRGFEVRKSEPLKKLKKLAEVKEEMTGIRRQMQALESGCNVKDYGKEKVMIMEMIMHLLLKLDAIQGLHESIRAVRKSIAKELVSLQETLDALVVVEKSSPVLQEQPSGMSSGETLFDMRNEDSNIELQNKDTVLEHDGLSKFDNNVSPQEEQREKQQVLGADALPQSKDSEKSVAKVTRESLANEVKDASGGTSADEATDSTSIVGGNDKDNDDVPSLMVNSSRDDEDLEIRQLFETQELCTDMSSSEDVSEDMGKRISDISPLEVHNEDPSTEETSEDDHMRRELEGYAVKEAKKADEMIISHPEQEVLDKRHEESQENEEERITDSVFPEMPHEASGVPVLPLGEDECSVDRPTEDPKEAENGEDIFEGDESTEVHITGESDSSINASQADEPDREQQPEKCLIEVSSTIDHEGQLEHSEPPKGHLEGDTGPAQFKEAEQQKDWLGTNTGPVPDGAATMLLHEGVSSFLQDDAQVEIQKEDQGLEAVSLRGSGGCNNDKDVLVTISNELSGGSRENDDHLPNSSVDQDLEKTDYELVPGGSEVVPPFNLEKSEINVVADEMENVGPIETLAEKMGEIKLSTDVSEEVQHMLTGNNNQADELDLTAPSETGSQASLESEMVRESDRKLMDENEKLRDMMEKLLEAGNKQLHTISELSSRVNDLEKKLATKKKKQLRFKRRPKALHPHWNLV